MTLLTVSVYVYGGVFNFFTCSREHFPPTGLPHLVMIRDFVPSFIVTWFVVFG